MNKYQEALEFLKSEHVTAWGNDNIDLLKKHLEVIEELVEKATPKKLKQTKCTLRCSNCGRHITNHGQLRFEIKYCPKCSQKIDWSEEDE